MKVVVLHILKAPPSGLRFSLLTARFIVLRGLRAGGLGGADMHAEPLLGGAHPGDLVVALSEVSARVPAREEVILVTRVTLDPFS